MHHRRASRVDHADDLLDIDPLQVHARGRDIRMPELPLDHRQRHALPGELDRVSMAELMRRKPAPHTRPPPRSGAAHRAPRSPTTAARASARRSRRTAHRPATRPGRRATERRDRSTPTRPSRPRGGDCLSAGSESIRVAGRDRTRSATSASWIRSPPRHSTTINARNRSPCLSAGVWRITATISSTVGGSAGYTWPLFLGACPALWPGIAAGERRLPAASSNNSEDIAPSLREQTDDLPALSPRGRSRHARAPRRSPWRRYRSLGLRQQSGLVTGVAAAAQEQQRRRDCWNSIQPDATSSYTGCRFHAKGDGALLMALAPPRPQ